MADHEQKWQGYVANLSNDSTAASVVVTCAWGDRFTVARALLNTVHSDIGWIYCNDISIEALGDAAAGGGPATALLKLSYKDPESGDGGGGGQQSVQNDWDNWKEHWEGGGEALTLGGGFMWSDTAVPIKDEDGVSAVRLVPQATITLSGKTSKNIVTGKDRIKTCMGKVNQGNLSIRGYVYSDNTLLFQGADMDGGRDAEGSDTTQISFKFSALFDHTWNQVWRAGGWMGGAGWKNVGNIDTDETMYSDALFSDLDPSTW